MSSRRTGRMGGGRAIGDTTARRLSKMARVNMFGREASKNRRVPKGKLRRAPLNPPPGYRVTAVIVVGVVRVTYKYCDAVKICSCVNGGLKCVYIL